MENGPVPLSRFESKREKGVFTMIQVWIRVVLGSSMDQPLALSVAHFMSQQQSASTSKEYQKDAQNEKGSALMPILAGRCHSLQNALNGPGQTPTLHTSDSETPISGSGGAECVALSNGDAHKESPEAILYQLVQIWPTLSDGLREQIAHLVQDQISN